MNCADAIKGLADLALRNCRTDDERLAVLESVIVVTGQLLQHDHSHVVEQLNRGAAQTANAMRKADELQLQFQDFLRTTP